MSSQDKKPLRQIAAEKVNGPNANPSQLGDPISLKAETNQNPPDNVEYAPEGAEVSPSSSSSSSRSPSNKSPSASHGNRTKAYGVPRNDPTDASSGGARTASGKRIPLEGDPTSLEREQVVDDTKGKGRGRRGSKL
ncbi:hypothetical protein GE21DRAFT_7480 [Neurospora crassa]|uniref:Uncharacterized protein n=2 Tax=Neurospora crassa TaxID=5141 RepID=Q1K8A7_NEUCR|nr:hypothetical protein NCU01060 [Neurospora crassa OR74A]EAA32436.1 hypothetical protein NCU01060 [Neurospora crassa OR74A]KHE88321.1 hypothetical protein GE21DRAFT_7480 [Neurospora crassa]CAD21332.1 hypothetical protein [Neurospora crassa]|eukprot:XP_961672.1 hypothetical protein NCU01060 [Neurospora crassa OR74A]